jgi:hypothetical protein
VLEQLPFPVVVEKELLSRLDVPHRVEPDLVSAFAQNILGTQVVLSSVPVVYESGQVSHKTGIDRPFWRAEIVETQIDTQSLPQQIDAGFD